MSKGEGGWREIEPDRSRQTLGAVGRKPTEGVFVITYSNVAGVRKSSLVRFILR